MRLVVLGAAGGVGRQVVAQAVASGHHVTACQRSPAPTPLAGVRLVVGDATDAAVVDDALADADAVICAVGMRRAVVANPWSRLRSPPDLCETVARHVIDVATRRGVRRVVAVSAAGVGDSAPHMNAVMRLLVASSSIGPAYRDLARMEAVLLASTLDVCCLRPVTLNDRPGSAPVVEVDHFGALMSIRRADVAAELLRRAAGTGRAVVQIANG